MGVSPKFSQYYTLTQNFESWWVSLMPEQQCPLSNCRTSSHGKGSGYYSKETILTTWLWLWFLLSSLSLFLLVFWICFSRLVNYLRYPMTFQHIPFSLSVSLSQFSLLTIQISECYLNKKLSRTTIMYIKACFKK